MKYILITSFIVLFQVLTVFLHFYKYNSTLDIWQPRDSTYTYQRVIYGH